MFELNSVPSVNGGSVTIWGEFTSVRDCTVAARAIQKLDDTERYFHAASLDDDHRSWGDTRIFMSPGEYTPDVEIVLSDGRIVWLGDVDEPLRTHLDKTVGPLKPVRDPYRAYRQGGAEE